MAELELFSKVAEPLVPSVNDSAWSPIKNFRAVLDLVPNQAYVPSMYVPTLLVPSVWTIPQALVAERTVNTSLVIFAALAPINIRLSVLLAVSMFAPSAF